MTVQGWTFLFVACTFGLYLFVAWRARVRDTRGFYVAGRGVPAVAAPFFETLASGCADVSSEVPALLGRPARALREYIREKAHTFAPTDAETAE